jgi:hypothetical protein
MEDSVQYDNLVTAQGFVRTLYAKTIIIKVRLPQQLPFSQYFLFHYKNVAYYDIF